MNKFEFLNALSNSLKGFSYEEVGRVLSYYDELISDKVEAGLNEYQVVHSLGDIKTITKQIQAELAGERLNSKKNKANTMLSAQCAVRNDVRCEMGDGSRVASMHNAQFTMHNCGINTNNTNTPLSTLHSPHSATHNAQFTMHNCGELIGSHLPSPISHPTSTANYQNYAPHLQQFEQGKKQKKNTLVILLKLLFSVPVLIPFGVLFVAMFGAGVAAVFGVVVGLGVSSVACIVAAIPAAVFIWGQGGAALALAAAGGLLVAAAVLGLMAVIAYQIGKLILKLMLKIAAAIAGAFLGGKKK
jgi:uncharacterized membrane protein